MTNGADGSSTVAPVGADVPASIAPASLVHGAVASTMVSTGTGVVTSLCPAMGGAVACDGRRDDPAACDHTAVRVEDASQAEVSLQAERERERERER